jgi:amino acid transporter
MSSPQFMLMGLDSVLHMAEECLEPRKVIPKALMAKVFVGSATAFGFAIAMVYSVPEMTDALSTVTG